MNVLLLLVIFAGVILIMSNELVAARRQSKIVYRYLPRDLDTYIRQQPYASVTFKSMFQSDDMPVGR